MNNFHGKKIIVAVCGGIAAYKSVFLVRELTRLGAIVKVVMTQHAEAFITPMTMQAVSGHEVRTELFDTQAERAMGHIELARWADMIIIAPLSANTMAKMAHGIADDILTTLYLVATVPIFVCPAMNHSMWSHPATQANFNILKARGMTFIGPDEGSQACGEVGVGRLTEVMEIIETIRLSSIKTCLAKQRVIITAGPTQEMIDPVRYITNRSSGKMGYALARAAQMAGAEVILISGPTNIPPPSGVQFISVRSANELLDAVMTNLQTGDIVIGCAAVGDFRVKSPAQKKMSKSATLTLELIPNPDIIANVAASKKARLTIGFAAQTHDVIAYAKEKLQKKNLDIIIANTVGENQGFDSDENEVTVITAEETLAYPKMHKSNLAVELIKYISTYISQIISAASVSESISLTR